MKISGCRRKFVWIFFLKKKEICASSLHICRLPGEAERVGHRANGTAVDADRDFTVQ